MASAVAPIEDTASMKEPTEDLISPMAMACGLTEESDVPSVPSEEKEKGELPHSGFPGWTEVLHPSQTMTPAGQAP